mmetsp:Transcript_3675/g.9237  ORF Transcript_3675/g.9237 Transcript_3675/m.9237 type:complete len:217 (+) Transcript_3675:448-1098(+)
MTLFTVFTISSTLRCRRKEIACTKSSRILPFTDAFTKLCADFSLMPSSLGMLTRTSSRSNNPWPFESIWSISFLNNVSRASFFMIESMSTPDFFNSRSFAMVRRPCACSAWRLPTVCLSTRPLTTLSATSSGRPSLVWISFSCCSFSGVIAEAPAIICWAWFLKACSARPWWICSVSASVKPSTSPIWISRANSDSSLSSTMLEPMPSFRTSPCMQ